MNPFLIACLSSWVVLHAAGAATASRPNFLVLLCDDLGWGDLACYGHPRIRTPHLDGLAKQGVRFTSCYSAAPVSSLDLLPTFCALGRAAVPRGLKLDGADLRPVFNGEPVKRDQPLFWVYFRALNDQRAALRDGPWKLLAKLDHGKLPGLVNVTEATAPGARQAALTDFSLYRLTDDPGEARDLSAEEPAKLQELSAKLETLYRELTATMHVWPDTPLAAPAQSNWR